MPRAAALLGAATAAAAAAVSAAAASAAPASPSSPPLRFGYYSATNLSATGPYTTVYQAASLPDALAAYAATGGLARSLLLVYDAFFTSAPYRMVLRPDWQQQWAALAADAAPFLANGTLLGFNLGDELVWNCLAPANLTVVVDAVRASFPRATSPAAEEGAGAAGVAPPSSAIIWYNEAAVFPVSSWATNKDSCGNSISDYSLASLGGLDWFSVDIYHMDGPVEGWVQGTVLPWYEANVFPNLTFPVQSAFLVPGSFASDVNHYPNGTYVCDRDCYGAMIALDAVDYFKWALADTRVATIMPWNWDGCSACNGSRWTPPHTCCMDEIGTKDVPVEISTWAQLASALLVDADGEGNWEAGGRPLFASREAALARVLTIEEEVRAALGSELAPRAGAEGVSWTAKGSARVRNGGWDGEEEGTVVAS